MLGTGNGIGTTFYGRIAEAEDGSYVTTVWVVIFFLPIIPLRSERILLLSEFDNGGGQTRRRFTVLERVPLDWRQIARAYLVGWGILAWYLSLIFLWPFVGRAFGEHNEPWLILSWLVLPFGIFFVWQKWFQPPPKLKPVEVVPGSEFSVYRKAETTDEK